MGINLGDQLLETLKVAAENFVLKNKDDALALGADLVKAILTQALSDKKVIAIPDLSANAGPEEIAEREELCTELSRQAQLVAAAEREDGKRIRALKARAIDAATEVGLKIGSVLLGSLLGALGKK